VYAAFSDRRMPECSSIGPRHLYTRQSLRGDSYLRRKSVPPPSWSRLSSAQLQLRLSRHPRTRNGADEGGGRRIGVACDHPNERSLYVGPVRLLHSLPIATFHLH